MDESDWATLREEQERERSINNALHGASMNPMRGSNICPNCKGRNDRAHTGHNICSACAGRVVGDASFNLPFPPSMNHIWRHAGKRTYLSDRAKAIAAVLARLLEQGVPLKAIAEPMRVTYALQAPTRRISDVDNYPKSVHDALTAARFWMDDSLVHDLRVVWADLLFMHDVPRVTKGGRVSVMVETLA